MDTQITTSLAPRKYTRYMVLDACADMPASCKSAASYRRLALAEIDTDELAGLGSTRPALISENARGVVRVLWTQERLFQGKTAKCAFSRALVEAHDEARARNEAWYGTNPDQLEADLTRDQELADGAGR